MRKHAIVWATAAVLLSIGVLLTQRSEAAVDDEVVKILRKLAATVEKGGDAAGEAKAAAKNIDELHDIMHNFKPRSKKGLGFGEKPGVVVPDGIELKVNAMARDSMTKAELAKEGDLIAEAGYIMAGIGHLTHNFFPYPKDVGKKTKARWNEFTDAMIASSKDLAVAAKERSSPKVKDAAVKLNNACNGCHMIFRP